VDLLLERWHIPNQKRRFNHSMAMNLVTRKLIPKYAAGIPTRPVNGLGVRSVSKKSRLLFIAPWRGCSIVGTYHTHYHGHPDGFAAEEEDVEDFIEEINGAYPDADLKREDILFSHVGLLPELDNVSTKAVRLIREGQVIDHQRESGIDGLITVVGVKYTSARYVAQQAVDIVFRKLNRGTPKCKTQVTPLHDSKIGDFTQLLSAGKKQELIDLDDDIIQHLIYNYGSKYTRLIKLIVKDPRLGQKLDQSSLLTRAEILYGIKYEMAQKLVDVILRRTELGSAGMPSETSIRVCVEIMGNEMSWDENRRNREITELKSLYAKVNNGSQKRKVSEKV
jgi:glycerol-3-phosphate dehydrogenase